MTCLLIKISAEFSLPYFLKRREKSGKNWHCLRIFSLRNSVVLATLLVLSFLVRNERFETQRFQISFYGKETFQCLAVF